MPAVCRCTNGHLFNSDVIENSPEINVYMVADEVCPECGAEFEVIDEENDFNDLRDEGMDS